jgi:phosphoglycerate dehydrogenase-like enzyme
MPACNVGILYKAEPMHPFDILPRHLEAIRNTLPDAKIVRAYEEAELIQSGAESQVLLTWGLYRPAEFCRAAGKLQWIHALTAGVDGLISVPEISGRRIRLSATKGIHGLPMAEHTLGMMLSFARGFHLLRDQQHRKEWKKYLACDEISGKTVGIVGLGEIGRVIAQRCKAMGMHVIANRLHPQEDPNVDCLYPADDVTAVMRDADYVVLTLPLTPETHHLIGENQFRVMKKSAIFINVARGKIVDEQALVRALKEGWIAGAALDCFETEPLPSTSELWDMPNVLISPHFSADSPYYVDRAIKVFCENLNRFIQGRPLLFELNWDKKY